MGQQDKVLIKYWGPCNQTTSSLHIAGLVKKLFLLFLIYIPVFVYLIEQQHRCIGGGAEAGKSVQ